MYLLIAAFIAFSLHAGPRTEGALSTEFKDGTFTAKLKEGFHFNEKAPIVMTVDVRRRRRTWYIVDPDPAVAAQYSAAGLDLIPGCKVLVDAEAMRPVALVDFDPAVSALDSSPMPQGFNPYFDLPAG